LTAHVSVILRQSTNFAARIDLAETDARQYDAGNMLARYFVLLRALLAEA
jgi:hypothetical protein